MLLTRNFLALVIFWSPAYIPRVKELGNLLLILALIHIKYLKRHRLPKQDGRPSHLVQTAAQPSLRKRSSGHVVWLLSFWSGNTGSPFSLLAFLKRKIIEVIGFLMQGLCLKGFNNSELKKSETETLHCLLSGKLRCCTEGKRKPCVYDFPWIE